MSRLISWDFDEAVVVVLHVQRGGDKVPVPDLMTKFLNYMV